MYCLADRQTARRRVDVTHLIDRIDHCLDRYVRARHGLDRSAIDQESAPWRVCGRMGRTAQVLLFPFFLLTFSFIFCLLFDSLSRRTTKLVC
jgi:hypothetical protein